MVLGEKKKVVTNRHLTIFKYYSVVENLSDPGICIHNVNLGILSPWQLSSFSRWKKNVCIFNEN